MLLFFAIDAIFATTNYIVFHATLICLGLPLFYRFK